MASGGVGGQLDRLRQQAAVEAARLANINPEGGKYHGEETLDQIGDTLSSATQATSNFLEGHWWGRNLKGNISNWSQMAIGAAGRMADYAEAESTRTPTNPGQALGFIAGNIGKSREQYTDVATDAITDNIKIDGKPIDPRITRAVTGEVLDTLATAGAGSIARKGLSILDKAVPPGTGGLMPVPVGVTDGLRIKPPVTEFKPSSVFQVAGNMEAAGWQGPIKSMLKEKVPSEQIAARMTKPYHGALKKGYISMTLEDLAKDKGGWLTKLIGRADDYAQGLRDWRVAKGQGVGSEGLARIQRQFYDNLTENPLDAFKQIYDPNNPIRKLLQKGFNTFAGKEWHHIFGNKDAAEFMLSTVAQDPYIAVNLFHFMKKLKLSTSGTPDNIALMSMKPHRGKGGWHSYSKGLGLEGKGKKAGDAAFSEWAQAVSTGILEGTTDINEIFSLLEVYSRLNKTQRDLLKTNYGAKIISEQGPIMQYIQGVAKKSPDQVLQ